MKTKVQRDEETGLRFNRRKIADLSVKFRSVKQKLPASAAFPSHQIWNNLHVHQQMKG